jgi:uncharacterized protein YnzC (UPF0291/DUF896 family)
MSNITIAKARKDGKWVILVDPDRPYNDHLLAYQKIANASPVSDEFSTVQLGRLHYLAQSLSPITAKENEDQKKQRAAFLESLKNQPKADQLRQAAIAAAETEKIEKEKRAQLAELNKRTAAIRKATGQKEIEPELEKPVVKTVPEPEK